MLAKFFAVAVELSSGRFAVLTLAGSRFSESLVVAADSRFPRPADYCPTRQTGGRLLADRVLSRLLKSDWPRTLEELEARKSTPRRAG